jgi:hypothetical protein
MPPASAKRESQYVMAPFFAKKEKEKRKKENLKFHNGNTPGYCVDFVVCASSALIDHVYTL